jgi:molybdopterin converting factor small subunit
MTQVHTQRAEVSAAPTETDGTPSSAGSAPVEVGSPTVTVMVRYFAAARAASGVDEERLAVAAPATVESVLAAAVGAHGNELERVLERCSYLLNTVAVHGLSTPLGEGDALDVLPPFAGG